MKTKRYTLILCSSLAMLAQVCLGQTITYCAGPPASGAVIQNCINNTPVGGQLELQPGTYNIDIQIIINKPMLLTTYGRANTGPVCFDGNNADVDWTCAVLLANPNLSVSGGMLVLEGPNITLDHIVVHGNRQQRSLNAQCSADVSVGMNIRCDTDSPSTACDNVTFRNGVSTSAPCGSGFLQYGANPNINNSMFSYNGVGDGSGSGFRSDGVDITTCKDGQTDSTCTPGGLIYNNYFFSNTDIDLIAFAGPGLEISSNHFQHNADAEAYGLGVIMLDNAMHNPPRGNFIGADVSENVIDCNGNCDFGIVLGGHPWYILQPAYPPCTTTGATPPYVCEEYEPLLNIYGGSVHDNQVSGVKQGIVADGAGRANWMDPTCNDTTLNCAIRIWNNTVQGTFGTATFFCGGHTPVQFATSPLNVRSGLLDETTVVCWGPNCVSSEVPPPGTTFNPWHGCW